MESMAFIARCMSDSRGSLPREGRLSQRVRSAGQLGDGSRETKQAPVRVLASGVRQADPIRKATRKPLDQMPSVNSPKLTEPEIESLASGARAKDCFVRQTRSFSSDLRHQDTVVSWDPASLASCVRLPLVGCTVVP